MGVLDGISKGKCYVEMSTVDEETVQDVADVSPRFEIVKSTIFDGLSIFANRNTVKRFNSYQHKKGINILK